MIEITKEKYEAKKRELESMRVKFKNNATMMKRIKKAEEFYERKWSEKNR